MFCVFQVTYTYSHMMLYSVEALGYTLPAMSTIDEYFIDVISILRKYTKYLPQILVFIS